jgi:hypothetical protein
MALSYSYEDTRPDRTNITFEWDILSTKRMSLYQNYENVIVEIEWKLIASKNKNSNISQVFETGIVNLSIESLDNFVNYFSLTKDEVILWVKNRINQVNFIENHPDNYITRIEDILIHQLNQGIIIDEKLPWD